MRWLVERLEMDDSDGDTYWFPWAGRNTEQEAQVALAKLALQHGGQWRIVKEE